MVDTAGFNARNIEEFRANHGQLGGGAGAPALLLDTVGARLGARVNPMMYLAGQDRYPVFASKAGSDRNPDRYYNLLAHPEVRIEVGDDEIAIRAVELRGVERATPRSRSRPAVIRASPVTGAGHGG
ncbi:nitroreductase/quinone reductase family protein [Streptomyces sp. AK02-04a]|uniref:nitroreductase/quinone reductase family protein n=1 Tax=Streptomyces sp. AK02-04a TaxID=3028649 RepID=UPI0029B45DFA|nr:nitroreductase/quinone reductase family protein [Streptomyces sp. AK02-04a]MDX3762574.1 nitroreductase/quinone reductase family protein [Streptomyces sp. AK02-04a]